MDTTLKEVEQYLDDNTARIAKGEPAQEVDIAQLVDFDKIHKDQVPLAVDCARKIAELCPETLKTYARGTRAEGSLRVHGVIAETQWMEGNLATALEKQKSGDNDPDVIRRLEDTIKLAQSTRQDILQLKSVN